MVKVEIDEWDISQLEYLAELLEDVRREPGDKFAGNIEVRQEFLTHFMAKCQGKKCPECGTEFTSG